MTNTIYRDQYANVIQVHDTAKKPNRITETFKQSSVNQGRQVKYSRARVVEGLLSNSDSRHM